MKIAIILNQLFEYLNERDVTLNLTEKKNLIKMKNTIFYSSLIITLLFTSCHVN